MPSRTVLLDTSFILALENKDDPHHARAKDLDIGLLRENGTLLLHWGILFEIADGYARISRRAKGIRLLRRFTEEKNYQICPISESLLQESLDLYYNRDDKDWGLTDCTSFVLMNSLNINEALTADIHFRQAGYAALLLE